MRKAIDKICLITEKSSTIRVLKLVTVKIWFYKVPPEAQALMQKSIILKALT